MKYILTIWLATGQQFPLEPEVSQYDSVEMCVVAGATISDNLAQNIKFSCKLEEAI